MGSGGQRSVKRRATGGAVASAKAQASTSGAAAAVANTAASAGSTDGGSQVVGRNLFGTETFSSADQRTQESLINDSLNAPQKNSYWAYSSGYQKFINNSGLDGKPQLMDSDEFDKASGPVLYRTVYSNSAVKADKIVESVANDDTFLYNAGGGIAHGVGMYTTPSYKGSAAYGRQVNSKDTSIMRFKIRDDAKIGSTFDLKAQYQKESKVKGTLAYTLAQDQRIVQPTSNPYHLDDSRIGIYAASKGYSVLVEATGLTTQKQFRQKLSSGRDVYTVVLNRGALIMDKEAKQTINGNKGKKWQSMKTNSKVK